MSGAPNDFLSLKSGGHVCLPYALEEERHGIVAGFIHDGLVRGERCIYWGQDAGFATLAPHLERRGVPVSVLRERGSLVLVDVAQVPPPQSSEGAYTAAMQAAVASARTDGYVGLRIASDPGTKVRSTVERGQLEAIENVLTRVCEDLHATCLCTFEQNADDPALLEVALATHEVAIIAGRLCANPYFKHAGKRAAWMATTILESATAHDLLEAESAALILESSRASRRDAEQRQQIAMLSRAVEARDRLVITAARWLARPIPAMCSRLDELAKDPRFEPCHAELETCDEHLAAVSRLSRGLDEIAAFLQMQVVLRPEDLNLVEVARVAIGELCEDQAGDQVEVTLEGAARIVGTWDRLRLTRLFYSLIRTAREQGYDARVRLRLDDLRQFARVRLEFTLPHAPSLSDSGERVRTLAYGPSGESDYERLAVQLWPAREIVRMMGGTLGISTWADARVIFTLDLPKSPPASLQPSDGGPSGSVPR